MGTPVRIVVYVVWLFIAFASGCSEKVSSGVLSSEDKAALLEQVKAAQEAVNMWDLDAMMKFTPLVVINLSGKDALEQAARAAMAQYKKIGD